VPATANRRGLKALIYGIYAWAILLFVVAPVTAACLLVPGLDRRRDIARWGAATGLRLVGSPVTVTGPPIPGPQMAVVVANHSSYLDGIILTAVLPPQYTFLIKREMSTVPIAGFVLRRLGSEFVDRSSRRQRHRSARRLVEAAMNGNAIAVFPEGTFDARPGLREFHTGAFRAALKAGLNVVPVVIHGARHKLPSGTWLPIPGPLSVEICPPVPSRDYSDERSLMLATRAAILERLGEPDLAEPEPLPPPVDRRHKA
jgi:1-acyl-sn-glycerol-3-phosphate acyltransferase